MTLFIEEGCFSADDDIIFRDSGGEAVFIFEDYSENGKVLIYGKNLPGERFVTIVEKPALMPKLMIMFGTIPFCAVTAKFSLFSQEIKIDAPSAKFEMIGACGDCDYAIYKDKVLFGKLEKKWFDNRIELCISAERDEDTAFMASLAVAAEYCVRKSSE